MRNPALILLSVVLAVVASPVLTAQTDEGGWLPGVGTYAPADVDPVGDLPSFRELLADDGVPILPLENDGGLDLPAFTGDTDDVGVLPLSIDLAGVGAIERTGDGVYVSGEWLPVDLELEVVRVLEQDLVTFRGKVGELGATYVIDERGDGFMNVDGGSAFVPIDVEAIPFPDGDGDSANATVGTTNCWLIPSPFGTVGFGSTPGYFGPLPVQVIGEHDSLGVAVTIFKKKRQALIDAGWIITSCP